MWVWVAMAWAAEPTGGERAAVPMCAPELVAAAVPGAARPPRSDGLFVSPDAFVNELHARVSSR
jgi:hypothetical protein